MSTNPEPNEALIARYLLGEASPSERAELEHWLAEDPERALEIDRYRKVLELGTSAPSHKFDTEKAWQKLKPKLTNLPTNESQTNKGRVVRLALGLSVAATLLIAIGLFFLFRDDPAKTVQYVAEISSGTTYKESILPDSSVVTLKPGSMVQYNHFETGMERRILLKGSARFKVKRNETKPFVVESQHGFVRVLGTTFTVETDSLGKAMKVSVIEGKVLVSNSPAQKANADSSAVVIVPGQTAVVGNQGKIKVQMGNAQALDFAFDKTLVFENTDLESVALLLGDLFRTRITLLGTGLENCRLTASFKQQSLDEILNIIGETFGLTIIKDGYEYSLKGVGC